MQSEDNPCPFVPGAEVAVVWNRRWSGGDVEYRIATIEKVHKTGRFTLVGSKQQWRPGFFNGRWSADETGDYGRSVDRNVELITEDLLARVERTKRRDKFRKLLGHIKEAKCPDDPTGELLSEMSKLASMLGVEDAS